MDRQQQLEARLGAALYRVARLKQQNENGYRLAPKLFQELERLTSELQNVHHELAESQAAHRDARQAAATTWLRAQILFEACPTASLVTDPDSVIVEANPAASALLNVSARHLSGKALYLFVHGERAEFAARVHDIKENERREWTCRVQPRERSPLWVDFVGLAEPEHGRLLLLTPRGAGLARQVPVDEISEVAQAAG